MAKVIHGKDGYLFLAGDQNGVILQHTGKRMLDRNQLSHWKKLTRDRLKRLDAIKSRFYMQIVPDKHSVYRQYLPDEFSYSGKKNTDVLAEEIQPVLKDHLNIPLAELRQSSEHFQTYHKTDTHWTDRGAYIGYCQLLEVIKTDFPDIEILQDPKFESRPYRGDLGVMIDSTDRIETDFFVESADIKTLFDNRVRVTGQIKVFENTDVKNSLTVVIFGGSSTTNFINYMPCSFRTVVFCWSANFDYGILDKYVPDIVIFQIRERFLIRPPDDETGFTTTEIAFAKNHGKNPETQIAPVRYDADELLISCLSKIGYVGNKAYESALGDLCNRMDIQDVFNYSLTIDRHRTQFKKVKKLIESALTGC